METVFTDITDYLLNQSWQIATLFAVVAVVCLALKKKTAHLRYLLWLLIVAKCLVPSLVTVSLAILPEKTQPTVLTEPVAIPEFAPVPKPGILGEAKDISPPAATPAPQPSIIAQLGQIGPKTWFSVVWLGGVGLYLLIVLIKAVRFNRRLGRERMPLGAGMQKEIDELLERFGIGVKTRIWLLDGAGQPFVWGLLRGAIYLPANFGQIGSREHRRGILMHEIAHALRFDAAVNCLQTIAQAIFWFHALVWWANRNIRAEREKCCDETAIARLSAAPRVYSSAIVDTLIAEYQSTQPVPSLAIAGPIKNIEDRIKTIMKPGKKFYNRPTIIAIVTILLLAIIAVPTTIALTHRQPEKPEDSLAKSAEQVQAVGEITFSESSAVEIINKVLAKYAGLDSYSSEGDVFTDMDMSGVDADIVPGISDEMKKKLQESKEFQDAVQKRQKSKHTFSAKLARPNLYCIEWSQKVHETFTNTGAVWSTGDGHYLLNAGRKTSPKDRRIALASATGVSGGAANIIPSLFFDEPISFFRKWQGLSQQADEDIDGDDCYVISGRLAHITITCWISQKTMLIRQSRQLLGGRGEMPDISEETIAESLEAMGREVTPEAITRNKKIMEAARAMMSNVKGTITETHRNIVVDQPIEPKRFIPAEAVKNEIEESLSPKEKSFNNLKALGLATIMYANDHEGQFPDSLKQLRPYLEMKISRWISAGNVEYVGKGKTSADNPQTVMAYDKTLLDNYATNVFFLDGHVEFCRRKRLETLGIAPAHETADAAFRAFIAASVKADSEGLKPMVQPGSGALQQISDLKQWHDLENVSIVRTSLPPNGTSVVTTGQVTDDRGRAGQLVFTMLNANHLVSPKHKWLVTSIDFIPATAADLDEDAEMKSSAESSAEKLKWLDLALCMYARVHEDNLPDSLEELKPYDIDENLAWARQNVEYLGKGKSAATDPASLVIAYDITLLKKKKGTNVLFNYHHIQFYPPEQLEKLGINMDDTPDVQVQVQNSLTTESTARRREALWRSGESTENNKKSDLQVEGESVMFEFQQALKRNDWVKALNYCSEKVKSKAKEYNSIDAFFNDVIPIDEIKAITKFRVSGKRRMSNGTVYHHHAITLKDSNYRHRLYWNLSALKLKEDSNWSVDFPTKPLSIWLKHEVLKNKWANQKYEFDAEKRRKGFDVRLIPITKEFAIGKAMVFRVEMKNVSDETLGYMHTSFMVNDPMVIKDSDGDIVPYFYGSCQTIAGPEFVEPGETVTLADNYDARSQYHIIKPGNYTFQFRGSWSVNPSNTVEKVIKPGPLPALENIVEDVLPILPEGWELTRILSPANELAEVNAPTEAISLWFTRKRSGKGFDSFIAIVIFLQKSTENMPHVKFKNHLSEMNFWGDSKWGLVYGKSHDAERLWPDWKEQIKKALGIENTNQKSDLQAEAF